MRISDYIATNLEKNSADLSKQFENADKVIKYFYIDNLLPEETAKDINLKFPSIENLKHNKTLRENKYIGVDLKSYEPVIGELLMAFQEQKIVDIIKKITLIQDLEPDKSLYAAGISAMARGNYLNPHLDNSHNADKSKYRALNLLYYLTPDWKEENGGNIELWPQGIKKDSQIRIHSKFNRLVVMSTHFKSWHSVSPVKIDAARTCFSNYYFTKYSPVQKNYSNVTTFRGRPENKIINIILTLDGLTRNLLRKFKKRNIKNISHIYKA